MMWRVLILLGVLSAWLVGCDEDDPKPADPSPGIFVVTAPAFLLCDVESTYVYMVRVENAPEVTSVRCTVTQPNNAGELTFDLYDDGGATPLASPEFASGTSLDVVPNNHTFTRGIRGDLLCTLGEGVYSFDFAAQTAHGSLRINNVQVELRELQDCVFDNVPVYPGFPGCFESIDFAVTITQPQNYDIDSVSVKWISGDDVWWETEVVAGTGNQWSFELAPTLFGLTPSGDNYALRVEAFTRFGLNCDWTNVGMTFENLLPELSNPQLPDTLYRPETPGDVDTIVFHITYDDCELAGWRQTQAVWFDVRREDLDWPPQTFPDFFLRNDGVPPDVTSGDNIASSYLLVPNNPTLLNNLYYFRFYSIDPASGDSTEYLLDSTRIIQNGTVPSVNLPSGDFGLSTFK